MEYNENSNFQSKSIRILKIERKFAESYVNATFKMPRIKTEVLFHANPMNMRFGPVEGDTALILQ